MNDLDSIGELCKATVTCDNCGKRQVIDQQMSSIDYCVCSGSLGYIRDIQEYENWRPFIEREHHIVWRRQHPDHSHLYAYKVYGTYEDVSLSAFMEVQLNCNYRTEWDDTALQLRVLGSHPHSNSDLVYWLVKFPTFFANRDYIFKRRFAVNSEKKEVVIMSEAIQADRLSEEKGVHRVNEYWSTMVIKATNDINQPGVEYTLTYFDNPGTSLPQSVTNFIAVTAFPNFLKKLHEAAISLQAVYEQGKDVYVSLPHKLRYPDQKLKDAIPDEPTEQQPVQGEIELYPLSEKALKCNALPSTINRETKACGREDEGIKDSMQLDKEMTTVDVRNISEVQADHETVVTSELHKHITQNNSETKNSKKPEESTITFLGKEKSRDEDIETKQSSKSQQTDTEELNKISSSHDRALSVGKKNVVIDLLEAMEVVTPSVEGNILLKKLEKLTGISLEDLEKQSVIIERIKKLKNKLKSFHEKATMKKQTSIRKMQELSNRDHYGPLLGDEKTLIQLELFLLAMRDVIQADRDMRTGKGLMNNNEEGNNVVTENPLTNNLSCVSPCNGCEHEEKCESNSTENEVNDKQKRRKGKTSHKPKPPDDPPPPPPPSSPNMGSSTNYEANNQSDNKRESGDREDQDGNNTMSNHESGKSISSWLGLPYIFTWRDTENKNSNPEPSSLSGDPSVIIDATDKPDLQLNEQEANSFIAQAWYVVGLGWIFHTENKTDIQDEDSVEIFAHHKQENSYVSKSDCDETQSSKWYWYPVTGVSRLYSWVFSASKVNA
ncbi:hypothetical protein Pmani_002179 [Petrolisthes manimaculis]|uniref:Phosphatidylcholine transfer protein n=1 Tax=Petrolisthes manimaculis TaxID=1843537 RepID=A0AAE1UNQ2_9EUCA|nr:hypothetical protein Pmani_002179 [Petrolisthes manimaculis]